MDFVSEGGRSTKGNGTMTVLFKQQFWKVLMIQPLLKSWAQWNL